MDPKDSGASVTSLLAPAQTPASTAHGLQVGVSPSVGGLRTPPRPQAERMCPWAPRRPGAVTRVTPSARPLPQRQPTIDHQGFQIPLSGPLAACINLIGRLDLTRGEDSLSGHRRRRTSTNPKRDRLVGDGQSHVDNLLCYETLGEDESEETDTEAPPGKRRRLADGMVHFVSEPPVC